MKTIVATVLLLIPFFSEVWAHPNHPLDDKAVYLVFKQANSLGIESGKICLERAEATQLRTMCRRLFNEREQMQQELETLIGELGIAGSRDDQANSEAPGAVLGWLSETDEDAFDNAMMRYETAYLKRVIRALEGGLVGAVKSERFQVFMQQAMEKYKNDYKEIVRLKGS